MKRFCFLSVLILSGAAFAQLATPTFTSGTGTYTNALVEVIQQSTSGVTYCASLNGTSPTAAVAGTCDSGFYTSINGNIAISASATLKVIVTKAGSTNSAVASATYTISTQAVTNPVSVPTPTKLTNSSGSTVAAQPFIAKDSSGNFFVFYSECGCGVSTDNGGTARVMFKSSTDGKTWSTPANVSCAYSGDPATGCLYDESTGTTANIATGGGLDNNGTLILLMAQWGGVSTATPEGIVEMRCPASCGSAASWTAPVFITTPTYTNPNAFINPTANLLTIAPGTPGVTGPCAPGCSFISVYGENAYVGQRGLIFSYDHGVTWSDPVPIPQSWPYTVEERAFLNPSGMNLIQFVRPTQDFAVSGGLSPNQMMVYTSSNLGTTWNSYTYNAATQYGDASNLPLTACNVTPGTAWHDTWTRPSVAINPNNPSLATLLYGERYNCGAVTTYDWKIASFNIASAFSANGQNLPLPQTLALDPITTTQPHTTYSYLAPLNSTQLLMAYEQGNTTTTEDIYTVAISYPVGQTVSGNIKLSGGIAIQ